MPGIGGTGVVTVTQILGMAALLDGKHACGLDQTGLAQKGGPVVSDVRISRDRDRGLQQGRRPASPTCCSASTCSAPRTRRTCSSPTRSAPSRSSRRTAMPTGAMVTDTGVRFPALRPQPRRRSAAPRARDENVYLDAQALSEALFGDHMPTNLLLLGAAYQHGCLPSRADAIEQAIRLNGAAVEKNLAAFRWGRAVGRAARARRRAARTRRRREPPSSRARAARDRRRDRRRAASCAGCSRSASPDLDRLPERALRARATPTTSIARVERERDAPGETRSPRPTRAACTS